jgi:thioredoxin-like negative regulator of GroEL
MSERLHTSAAAPPSGGRVDVLFVTKRTSGVGRRMESVVASLLTRNRARVALRVVDADAQPELVERLGVRDVPAVVFVQDRHPVACLQGRATLEDLEEILKACA